MSWFRSSNHQLATAKINPVLELGPSNFQNNQEALADIEESTAFSPTLLTFLQQT